VTKEKLAQDLLERVYGGRVWASLDTPGEAHTPETDFPVGQMWLRPRFVVENLALNSWIVSGWSASVVGTDWVLTTDGSQAEATATQLLENVGQAGQTVWIHLDIPARSDHLAELELYLNGVEYDLMEGGGTYETTLDQTGALELTIRGQWHFAETNEVVRVGGLAVVNTDALETGYIGCHPLSDWPAFLESQAPFVQVVLPRTMWVQETAGQWKEIAVEVLPVERGGTGLSRLTKGQMLYAGSEQSWASLNLPAAETCLLGVEGQQPAWKTSGQISSMLGQLQVATGTYTGSNSAKNVTLPVTPKLLYIYSKSGLVTAAWSNTRTASDKPAILINGATAADVMNKEGSTTDFWAGTVTLSGNTLSFGSMAGSTTRTPNYMNRYGVVYQWLAIY